MSSQNTMESEIEAESQILKEIQNKMSESLDFPIKSALPTAEEQKEKDSRSIFIGNVDFNSTSEELEKHFNGCGLIVRTTIPKDKFTGKQKNIAFIEFESVDSLENALAMNGSFFRERKIIVTAKRTNKPGMGSHRGMSRGGRGTGRGGKGSPVVIKYVYVNGQAPRGAFRGGRGRFTPY